MQATTSPQDIGAIAASKVQNLEITEWESPVVIGGRCRIQVSFEYAGPKTTRVLYAAIGHQYPNWFNEKVAKELTITISAREEIRKSYYFIDIPITSALKPSESPFDLYTKVDGIFPEAISPIYKDVITVSEEGVPPAEEFKNLEITTYTEEVDVGGICRVETKFDYQGPETERGLYAAIGHQYPTWFNEKVAGEIRMAMPETPTFTKYYCGVDIPITLGAIDPAESPFDLYAKVKDGLFPLAESEHLYDVITVVAPPEEYAGSITGVWINKSPEGTELPPDTTVVADGNTFEVGTRARNDSSVTFTGTVQVIVYDPDHVKRADKSDSTGIGPGQELCFGEALGCTFNICHVDKAGDWIIVVVFRGDEVTLNHKEYIMTAIPQPEFQNFVVTGYDGVPVDEQLMVVSGQTATVHMTVDYRGPAIDGAIWTAMGWYVGVVIPEFIEAFNSRTPVHFDESYDFLPYEIDCKVDILSLETYPIEVGLYGTVLDMYAKIMEVPGPDIYTPFYEDVIVWSKPIEEYELIQHTIYPYAYIYDGDVEITTATFRIDPFTPSAWAAERFANSVASEARKAGGRILELKVYVDTTPLLWTDIRIEATGTPLGEATGAKGVGVAVGIPLWVPFLIKALAVIGVIVAITIAVKTIARLFQHKPGLEDVKVGWGRETLTSTIRDSEEYWERPLTPIETLEGMSEGELRDHLDQIAEEEVPPPVVPWWVWPVGIGVVAVVGIGVVVAAKK